VTEAPGNIRPTISSAPRRWTARAKTPVAELVTYHGEIAKERTEHRGTVGKALVVARIRRMLDAQISQRESGAAT
jgi:hypothetical protein